MKKYLVTLMTIVTMAFATGCPEGDDDADAACIPACAPGYVCLYGDCVPEGSDADADDNGADGDSDADEAEDDASDENAANCSNIAGTWEITYLPAGIPYTLHLAQDGCSLTGDWDSCIGTGEIYEDSSLVLDFGPDTGCGGATQHLTGNLTTLTRMTGNWSSGTGGGGTWEATLQ